MDPRNLIAARIDLQLRRHLGNALDSHRALTDAHYMRDVLFVCDAMKGTGLPLLARQFRVAGERMVQEAQPRPGHDEGPPQGWAANTSGFGVSRPPQARGAAPRAELKPWFSPSRWFSS
ncbi:MAG: hypothetical protein Q8L49_12690 [Burkholderiaceae bacterium]|nr:hypothetical protein [Burkholderiaceae bacterium]